MNTQPVAEIVTFRITKDTDPVAFVKAASAMEPFLKATGGMIRRNLSVDADGLWTDHILWSSMVDAQRAAGAISTAPEAKDFITPIVGTSVTLRHATLQLQQE